MKRFIKSLISGKNDDVSSKRVCAIFLFIVAAVGFFMKVPGFESFLIAGCALLGVSIIEKFKK